MSLSVRIRSEAFTLEGGAWVSEGKSESIAPCRFFYRPSGDFSLSYDTRTEDSRISTKLAYEKAAGTLTLSQTGDVRYTAVFGGEECAFVYAVSAFVLDAVAKTESLEVSVGHLGGEICLTYLLTLSDIPRRIRLTAKIN